ncbi:Late embryogenesis abundant protein [compost metagenome]
MPIQTRASVFLALFILLGLGGCSTWLTGNFEDPEIRLVKVEVIKARLLEQQFKLHFRIDNPNDSSLPIRGLQYTIYLNDLHLAEGESNDWFTVPAKGHELFVVPVRTNLWQHLREIAKLLKKSDQPIRYRLEGELATGLFFGHDLHLSRSGEIIPGDFIPE